MTIGELISLLETFNQGDDVYFDFCGTVPTHVSSWRGVYAEAALGWSERDGAPTVAELIARLRSAIGQGFDGWKGGEFIYSKDTPIHIDNPGKWTSTEISGVVGSSFSVFLQTTREPW